jgi:GAF domain-containing protein/two-component sensor histidine kinase
MPVIPVPGQSFDPRLDPPDGRPPGVRPPGDPAGGSGSVDVADTIDRVVVTALRLLRARRAALYELDPPARELVCVATAGPGDPALWIGRALPIGTGAVGAAVARGRVYWCPDVGAEWGAVVPEWMRARIRDEASVSVAAAPLVARGELLGGLSVGDGAGRAFGDAELDLLASVADQAALAIQNERLYAEARHRRREAELVAELARDVGGSLDLDMVLARLADAARELTGSEGARAALRDPGSDRLLFGPTGVAGGARAAQGPSAADLALVSGHPVRTDGRARASGLAGGALVEMAVPIRLAERVEGVLCVFNAPGLPFTDRDEAVLLRLADHASIAIRNARLFADATRQRRETAALARAARTFTESRDVAAAAHRIVASVRSLFGARSLALRLLQPDGSLVALTQDGGTEFMAGHVLPLGVGVSARAVATGAPAWTSDILADGRVPLSADLRERIDRAGLHAILCAPLVIKGRTIGVLSVGDTVRRAFTEAEVALLQAFADEVALALETARLYEEAERRRQEAELVAELVRAINASLDVDTVLQRITEGARELTGADLANIALREPGSPAMVSRYWAGSRPGAYEGLRIEPGKGSGGLVLVTGQPFRTTDYAADPRIDSAYLSVVQSAGIVAQLVVPIHGQDRLEGLIYVGNRSARPFTEADEAVLVRLADHAAIALRNAQLFSREQTARTEAETLTRRYHDLVQSLDAIVWECDAVTWRYSFVSQRAESLLGYPVARWLADPDFRLTLVHPDDREATAALSRAAIREDRDHQYEYRAVRADRRVVWLRDFVYVVRDPGGPARQLRGLTVDVTGQHQASEIQGRLLNAVISAQEEERGRLARELHDETGQALASLLLGLSALENARTLRAAREGARRLFEVTKAALSEVRRLAWGLRPSVLDDLGLVAALERYATEYTRARGIAATVDSGGLAGRRLPAAMETALYRIVQEALANVAKHAGARAVLIAVERGPGGVRATVTDNGCGFDAAAALADPGLRGHFGLHSMRERAALLSGTLEIDSVPGRGTTLRVELPFSGLTDGEDPDPARG